MSGDPAQQRAFLVTNPSKDRAVDEFERLRDWLRSRGQLAGAALGLDSQAVAEARPDRIVTLGGDGTILAIGRSTARQGIPMVGVNLGKLGYLASYSTEGIREHIDAALSDESLVSSRMMLQVNIEDATGFKTETLAVNDCVLHAGPPYRMLTVEIFIGGERLTTIMADGIIVSTPTGSTAHNMASGGPVLEPEVDAIVLTSICPHSFAHRPVVLAGSSELRITIVTVNESSTAIIDGQVSLPARAGTVVTIRRADVPFRLVRHPRRTSWQALVYKLRWGERPAENVG